jgi:hypothetical protein
MDNRSQSVSIPRGENAGDDARTREIRAEIEQTREDLSETVEAIQEKLRPSNIAASAAAATTERVKDMAQSAADTADEWWEASGGNGLMDRLRNNPVPALLAGVGLAWLAFSDGNRRRYPAGYRPERYRPQPEGNQWRDTRHELMESASEVRERSGEMLRRGRHNLELMIRDYPLAVGAAAAVLGATLGMVVPETEQENELMGEARDTAVERAQQVASGAAARVKEAAADAVSRSVIGE